MEKEPITIQGLEKLKQELKFLKEKKRPEIVNAIAEARSHGDLKENAEYHAAREEQSLIIRKMQTLQSYSPFQIIEEGEIETDTVGFGNKVTILEEGKEEAEDYYLLGPIESEMDLFPLVVTVHSPFGQSIIGLEVGDDFTLDIRGVDTRFTITAIDKVSSEK